MAICAGSVPAPKAGRFSKEEARSLDLSHGQFHTTPHKEFISGQATFSKNRPCTISLPELLLVLSQLPNSFALVLSQLLKPNGRLSKEEAKSLDLSHAWPVSYDGARGAGAPGSPRSSGKLWKLGQNKKSSCSSRERVCGFWDRNGDSHCELGSSVAVPGTELGWSPCPGTLFADIECFCIFYDLLPLEMSASRKVLLCKAPCSASHEAPDL